MEYNTKMKTLALPGYGRNMQRMVDYCVTIADREERRACAETIVRFMGNMFPYLREMERGQDILWNQLALMSDFQLDIDYPCAVVRNDVLLTTKPSRIENQQSPFRYRHYGKLIERMIVKVSEMEESEEKKRLIALLANQLKRLHITWNKNAVEDDKILSDFREMSGHRIEVGNIKLTVVEGQSAAKQQQAKKKSANGRNRSGKRGGAKG